MLSFYFDCSFVTTAFTFCHFFTPIFFDIFHGHQMILGFWVLLNVLYTNQKVSYHHNVWNARKISGGFPKSSSGRGRLFKYISTVQKMKKKPLVFVDGWNLQGWHLRFFLKNLTGNGGPTLIILVVFHTFIFSISFFVQVQMGEISSSCRNFESKRILFEFVLLNFFWQSCLQIIWNCSVFQILIPSKVWWSSW